MVNASTNTKRTQSMRIMTVNTERHQNVEACITEYCYNGKPHKYGVLISFRDGTVCYFSIDKRAVVLGWNIDSVLSIRRANSSHWENYFIGLQGGMATPEEAFQSAIKHLDKSKVGL